MLHICFCGRSRLGINYSQKWKMREICLPIYKLFFLRRWSAPNAVDYSLSEGGGRSPLSGGLSRRGHVKTKQGCQWKAERVRNWTPSRHLQLQNQWFIFSAIYNNYIESASRSDALNCWISKTDSVITLYCKRNAISTRIKIFLFYFKNE